MSHLPYVVAAYVLGVAIPGGFALSALLRMRAAQRRLIAMDPRARRSRANR
jgi:hypothetical protein